MARAKNQPKENSRLILARSKAHDHEWIRVAQIVPGRPKKEYQPIFKLAEAERAEILSQKLLHYVLALFSNNRK